MNSNGTALLQRNGIWRIKMKTGKETQNSKGLLCVGSFWVVETSERRLVICVGPKQGLSN